MATTKTSTSIVTAGRLPDNWEIQTTSEQQERGSFSADDVINAYIQGKKAQDVINGRILEENLKRALELSSSLSDTLNKKEIKCNLTLLKPKQITEFESIFVIDGEDYNSAQFEEVYRLTVSKKAEVNDDTFHFSYIFIPDSENLDRKKLSSNGYVFEYKR